MGRLNLLTLLLLGFALGVAITSRAGEMNISSIVCTCRCCYQGGCSMMPNFTWVVASCDQCSTNVCNDYIRSNEVLMEMARLFEGIESNNSTPNNVGRLNECKVISVLEAATCASSSCKRTTTIKAECYNRDAPLIKYSIVTFVVITVVAIVFGIIKNHIPAFQGLNEKYFNY